MEEANLIISLRLSLTGNSGEIIDANNIISKISLEDISFGENSSLDISSFDITIDSDRPINGEPTDAIIRISSTSHKIDSDQTID